MSWPILTKCEYALKNCATNDSKEASPIGKPSGQEQWRYPCPLRRLIQSR